MNITKIISLPIFVDQGKVVSFNGRGICLSDLVARANMGHIIRQLSQSSQILCFQEVHGFETDVRLQFQSWLPHWSLWISVCKDSHGFEVPGTGGEADYGQFDLIVFVLGWHGIFIIECDLGDLHLVRACIIGCPLATEVVVMFIEKGWRPHMQSFVFNLWLRRFGNVG